MIQKKQVTRKEVTVMFGYIINGDEVIIEEGSQEELESRNIPAFSTQAKAKAKGNNALFQKLKKEWKETTDFTTERAVQLEKLMYKDLSDHTDDYTDNMYVIQKLEEELQTLPEGERKALVENRLKELKK